MHGKKLSSTSPPLLYSALYRTITISVPVCVLHFDLVPLTRSIKYKHMQTRTENHSASQMYVINSSWFGPHGNNAVWNGNMVSPAIRTATQTTGQGSKEYSFAKETHTHPRSDANALLQSSQRLISLHEIPLTVLLYFPITGSRWHRSSVLGPKFDLFSKYNSRSKPPGVYAVYERPKALFWHTVVLLRLLPHFC